MAKYDGVNRLGVAFCHALGIDPNSVVSIDISLNALTNPVVTVRMDLPDEAESVLREFRLNPELIEPTTKGGE